MLASTYETAVSLTGAGVMTKRTMIEFGEMCLTPVRPAVTAEIWGAAKEGRRQHAVFAYLNARAGLVSEWERGEKHP